MERLSLNFFSGLKLISRLFNGLNIFFNQKKCFPKKALLVSWFVEWKKCVISLYLIWYCILNGCSASGTEDGELKIPQDYLIPFMKEALQLVPPKFPDIPTIEINEDLVEGPDSRDYIRLINIRLLFQQILGQPQNLEINKKLYWLLNLSRQIDALNIHDGSLRDLMTLPDSDGMFWRRLAYLHHGFSIPELALPVKEYIINQIWLSDDLPRLNKLVEEFFLRDIFKYRCKSSRIKSKWLDRISIVLAWPSLVPSSWMFSPIPLKERIMNFYSLFRRYDSINNSNDDSDPRDEVENVLIHPYLKASSNPNQQFEIFGKNIQTVIRRAREINKETFDRKSYDKLQSEIDELTKKINLLQVEIRESKKQLALPLSEKIEILQKLKKEREEKKEEKHQHEKWGGHLIDNTIKELVEVFEAFGNIQLEKVSKNFKGYHQAISSLSFDNILFYVGLLNEFEHLRIAHAYLEHVLTEQSDPDVMLQALAVVSEALNNTFLPATSDIEDLNSIKEIFRFFRNKVVKQKTFLIKQKMASFLKHPSIILILDGILEDLKKVQGKILVRFQKLSHIVRAEGEWESDIISLKNLCFGKIQKVQGKDDLIEWKYLGIPALSGLMRYFKYKTYALEQVLEQDDQLLKKIQQDILQNESPQNYLTKDKERDNTESSTLQELRTYTKDIDDLMGNPLNISTLKERLKDDFKFRLKFIRTLSHIKESFSYLAESMEEEYLAQVLTVFDEKVLWHFYYDLRDRRNLVTHDLWRSDVNGLISTALRIQNILKPAVMGLPKPLEANQKFFEYLEEKTVDRIEALIINHQLDPNGVDSKNHTLLFYAIKMSNRELVKSLLRYGANPNLVVNRKGDTLLHIVLKKYYDKIIFQDLVLHGALTDTKNAEGETPYSIVLKHTFSENSLTRYQYNFADRVGDKTLESYRTLEDLRSQQGYQRGFEADKFHTELRIASPQKVIENLDRLIEREGYNVNLYDEYGEIPLCLALGRRFKTEDSCELLKFLLSQGAHPDRQNYIGIQEAALHLAAQIPSIEPTSILIKSHANLSIQNAEKTTPLHYSVGFRNFDVASLLLTSGADIHARDCFELTPILVCDPQYLGFLELLLSRGANPNDRDPYHGTLLEVVEGMLDADSPTYRNAANLYKTRQLLLQHGAYPVVRMTPLIFTTIAFHLSYLKGPSSSSVLPRLKETYDFKRMLARWESYLSLRPAISEEESELKKEKELLIYKKIKNHKKFIVVIGSPIIQDQVVQNMLQTIKSTNLTSIERNQLLQLIPGQENVIADFATESLEGLIDISTQLPEKDSDSEKKFKKDYENTQKLLRKTLSTNFPSGLSNTEIVDFMSLKANESKSDGFHKLKHKLKKFMGERQNFYETSYKKEHSLQPCYYAYGQHFTYFGLNPKTTSMILKKIASLSHLSSLKRLVLNDLKLPWPDFKKDKKIPVLKGISKNLVEEFEKYPAWNHGIIGKGMLEALTHAWHPYGVQARVQVWERIANSARITPAESIGFHASPDNDTIHFLKINLQGDMLEHYIPMDVMEYDYTSTLFI